MVMLGDSGVGKTSLCECFKDPNSFTQQFKSTVGADFKMVPVTVGGKQVNLQIWDTAGQERYMSLGYAYYRGADCCVLVYDITNP